MYKIINVKIDFNSVLINKTWFTFLCGIFSILTFNNLLTTHFKSQLVEVNTVL